jgi:nucleotide-binding universal stress UspA family protein
MGVNALEGPERDGEAAFRRILVAFDGSAHAHRVLAGAVELAQGSRGRLTVLMVLPERPLWVCTAWEAPVITSRPEDLAFGPQLTTLDRCVTDVPADIPVVKLVKRGAIVSEVLAEARNGAHDAIVMGSDGKTRRSWLAGSISRRVVRESPVPVLVVAAARARSSRHGRPGRMRVG